MEIITVKGSAGLLIQLKFLQHSRKTFKTWSEGEGGGYVFLSQSDLLETE